MKKSYLLKKQVAFQEKWQNTLFFYIMEKNQNRVVEGVTMPKEVKKQIDELLNCDNSGH